MYIVEKPKHQKGLYAIINIIEKRVYIGESIDMPIRAQQHLVIISNDQRMQNADNKYMMMEENKQFWFLPIAFEENSNNLFPEAEEKKELKDFLQIYERIFMYLVATNVENCNALHEDDGKNHVLYNNAKNKATNLMWKELIQKIKEFHVAHPHSVRDSIAYTVSPTATNKEIRNAIELLLTKVLQKAKDALNADLKQRFGITMSDWNDMSKGQRMQCWDQAVEKLKREKSIVADYFLLDENSYSFTKDYAATHDMLGTPNLSKLKAKELGIQWGEKSIFDSEMIASLLHMGIINKFGSHHGETPYEILLKMQMDIQHCGHSFWALKNINEDWVRKVAERAECERQPIYAIFSLTDSDSTNQSKEKINLQRSLSENDIIKNDVEYKSKNGADLMNWWRESDRDQWKPIDNRITYITISGRKKAVGFNVTKFWFTEEVFSSSELYQHFIAMPWGDVTEVAWALSGQQTAVCVKLKSDKVEAYQGITSAKSDWVNGLIVKLEYPYVVQLTHDISHQ